MGHKVPTHPSAQISHNLAALGFSYWIDLYEKDDGGEIDGILVADMLDRARRPVRTKGLLSAILGREINKGEPGYAVHMRRLRDVTQSLLDQGVIRRVRLDNAWAWVPTSQPLTNDEWRELDQVLEQEPLLRSEPAPMISISAPEAHVVIVSSQRPPPDA